MERSEMEYAWRFIAFFFVYLLSARIGLSLSAFVQGNVTLLWPPSGIALSMLLLLGRRYWPAITLGAFVVTALTRVPLPVALGVAIGNTLEAMLAASLLCDADRFHLSLDNSPSVLRLIVHGALLSTLVSACIGTVSLWASGVIPSAAIPSVGQTWWVGDMLSDLLIPPLVLTWTRRPRDPLDPRQWGEALVLGVFLFGMSLCVLADPLALGLGRYSLAFIVFPGIIWSALRFGQRGVTAATVLVSSLALWSVTTEPELLMDRLREHLLLLQVFIGVLAATGLVLGAAAVAHRRAEAESLALVEQLQAAVRARDEFLSVASHELKTPLAALALQIEALNRMLRHKGSAAASALQAEQYEMVVGRTQRHLHRLTRLVESLLDGTHISMRRVKIEPGPVDLAALLREIVDNHQHELERAQCRVGLEVEACLVGQWDQLRLEQVFTNLLTNAIKFGAGKPITLRVRQVGDTAEVQVQDHGIGIERKDQERIFERFERAVSSRDFGGLGLGLFISRQIVREHGGSIRIESTPGQGATFIVELPLEHRSSGRDSRRSQPTP